MRIAPRPKGKLITLEDLLAPRSPKTQEPVDTGELGPIDTNMGPVDLQFGSELIGPQTKETVVSDLMMSNSRFRIISADELYGAMQFVYARRKTLRYGQTEPFLKDCLSHQGLLLATSLIQDDHDKWAISHREYSHLEDKKYFSSRNFQNPEHTNEIIFGASSPTLFELVWSHFTGGKFQLRLFGTPLGKNSVRYEMRINGNELHLHPGPYDPPGYAILVKTEPGVAP